VLAGRYRVVRVLGAGGTSTVYLADDLKLKGKRWALKEMRYNARNAGRFIAEAEMLIRLSHVHLPDIVDFYPPDLSGYSYLVMDFIEGLTLLQLFEQGGGTMPEREVAAYAVQLCDLFHYLHEGRAEPIIYRDLKPSNVMVDGNGHVKLVDFGIARSFKQGNSADTVQIGTIGFAAPEQFEGTQTDARTDLYTLGAMMYFLLSGGQYYYTVQKSLRQLNRDFPAALDAIVHKLLRPAPEERFQNALDVKKALERWLQESKLPSVGTHISVSGSISTQLIVVGSMYSGAGATFSAIALAKAIEAMGFGCSVIERTGGPPELYALLFGEKNAPSGYQFYTDSRNNPPLWQDGGITWYPLPPDRQEPIGWTAEQRLRLFYRMKRPFIVVDIGTQWLSPETQELLQEADIVIGVFDPLLHKLGMPEAIRRLHFVEQLRESGKPVHYIANKFVGISGRDDWLKLIPRGVSCILPAVDFTAVVDACWKGTLVHDRPDISRKIAAALRPLVSSWIPADKTGRSFTGSFLKSWFTTMFRKQGEAN
jgi:serine/threonine-protein kinase